MQADNRVLGMPRGSLYILKRVLGMHAQVVTKPSLATSGQLTIILSGYEASVSGIARHICDLIFHQHE